MHGFGPVPIDADRSVFDEAWERRMFRIAGCVMARTTIDRFRYTIEQIPPPEYLTSSYYERWLWALERPPPIARPSPATPTWAGRFATGDEVRVRNAVTSGHTRVPRYLRGHVGRI